MSGEGECVVGDEVGGLSRGGRYRRRLVGGARAHRTVIKHTDEEYARVGALAQLQGVSVPRLYEQALHAGDVAKAAALSRIVGELALLLRLISGAASNLNQLAWVANSTGEVEAAQVLAAAVYLDAQVVRLHELVLSIPGGDLYKDDVTAALSAPRES